MTYPITHKNQSASDRRAQRPSGRLLIFGLLASLAALLAFEPLWAQGPGARPDATRRGQSLPENAAPARTDSRLNRETIDLTPAPYELADRPGLLDERTWEEHSFGVRFRVPRDAIIDDSPSTERLVAVRMPDLFDVTVSLVHTRNNTPTNLPRAAAIAVDQMVLSHPRAQFSHYGIRLMNAPARLTYYLYPERLGGPESEAVPVLLGEAITLLASDVILIVRFRCKAEDAAKAGPYFEAMLQSFTRPTRAELDAKRIEMVVEGAKALEKTALPMEPSAYHGDQWFRVLEEGRDVGYMKLVAGPDKQLDKPGVRVAIQTRVYRGQTPYEGLSNFFASEDGELEIWSIGLTERQPEQRQQPGQRQQPNQPQLRTTRPGAQAPGPVPQGPPMQEWSETGLRSRAELNINRRSPTGPQEIVGTIPPSGYLSQVQLLLIHRLLPTDKAQTYGFYGYNHHTGTVSFRTETVVPEPNGVTIRTRPSPDQKEIVSQYDTSGKLIRRVLANGQVMQASTRAELAGIWLERF